MRLGSLYTGFGLMDLGLERAGMVPAFQVEIEEHAHLVLQKHWPDVPRFHDIRAVSGKGLPACDVLAGGFPCQDVSAAGGGAGLDGERSGLWVEFARLIREIRPRYVLVENSPRLRSRGLGRVLGDLASCGYDAEWQCIPAGALGAPHLRERLFVVAYAAGDGRGEWGPWRLAGGAEGSSAARVPSPSQVFDGPPPASSWWRDEPGVRRVAYGTSARVFEPRLRGLGNGVVVQVAEWLGRRILRHAKATGRA